MYFCRLSPDEFRHVCEAYGDSREALLPLPWERKPKHEAVPLHEDKARLEMLMKKKKKG